MLFSPFYVDAATSCCAPHVSNMLSSFVRYTHAPSIYVFSCPSFQRSLKCLQPLCDHPNDPRAKRPHGVTWKEANLGQPCEPAAITDSLRINALRSGRLGQHTTIVQSSPQTVVQPFPLYTTPSVQRLDKFYDAQQRMVQLGGCKRRDP